MALERPRLRARLMAEMETPRSEDTLNDQALPTFEVSPQPERALTQRFELVCGVTICTLMVLLITPSLALCILLSVTLTLLAVSLTERRNIEEALDKVTLDLTIPERVRRGEEARLELKLTNRSLEDLWGLEVMLRGPQGISSIASVHLKPHHNTGSTRTLIGHWPCPHYRAGEIWGAELRFVHRLGLTRSTRHIIAERSIHVIPNRPLISWRSLSFNEARSSLITHDQSMNRARSHDGDFSELRPYIPSDHWRAIAWRPSARRGQLMTRTLEQSRERRYVIALDVSAAMRAPLKFGEAETLVDFALDLISGWIAQIKEDQVGVIVFDHRALIHIPVLSRARLKDQLEHLLHYAARPLDSDCTLDTLDELWSRAAHYLEWSGVMSARPDLTDQVSMYAFSSHLLTTSYQLGVVSNYLDQLDIKGTLDHIQLDEITLHDRLRKLLYRAGVVMQPRLSPPELEWNQGLREVLTFSERERATHLIMLSSRERLHSPSGRLMLRRWASTGGMLQTLDLREVATRSRERSKSRSITSEVGPVICRWEV